MDGRAVRLLAESRQREQNDELELTEVFAASHPFFQGAAADQQLKRCLQTMFKSIADHPVLGGHTTYGTGSSSGTA